jgi:hypothetical protein
MVFSGHLLQSILAVKMCLYAEVVLQSHFIGLISVSQAYSGVKVQGVPKAMISKGLLWLREIRKFWRGYHEE